MIVQIPFQLPLFDRPYLVVLTTGGADNWGQTAARELESSFDSVVLAPGVKPDGRLDPNAMDLYLRVVYACLERACGVACWFGSDPFWQWLELGTLIEGCPERLVLGMPESYSQGHHARHARWLMQTKGFRVWDNLEDVITAARQLRLRTRREEP